MAKEQKGDNLVGDISELPLQRGSEVDWFSKGDLVGGYGTQKLSQPSDGDLAARAFSQQADPIEPGGGLAPKEPGDPVPPPDPWSGAK
jgi:hypothetical protein